MKSLLGKAIKNHWHYAYLFISPVLVFFGLFRIYPSIQTLVFSFFDVNIIARKYRWVGLENFRLLLQDSDFLKAIGNTFIYTFYIVVFTVAIGMVLASLFSSKMKMGGLFRAVYFAPFITATVAAAVVWSYLYDPKFGLFNMILKLLHMPGRHWLTSSEEALGSVIIFSIWKYLGYTIVLFVAGLQNIPHSYYEAATIDGAGPVVKFLRITVPMLAPTIVFVVIYNTILALKVFDQVFVLTAGGPAKASTVVVLEIYEKAFLHYRFGYAASMAFVLFLFVLVITVAQYLASRRLEVNY